MLGLWEYWAVSCQEYMVDTPGVVNGAFLLACFENWVTGRWPFLSLTTTFPCLLSHALYDFMSL
jgi:hypothetical protein